MEKDLEQNINDVVSDPTVIKIYANHFITGISNTDSTIVFKNGSSASGVLNLSHEALFILKKQIDQTCDIITKIRGDVAPKDDFQMKIEQILKEKK